MAYKREEKIYEVGFHLVPTIDADAVSGVFDRVKGVVSKVGEILSEEVPVRRDLAYTVRHTVRRGDGSYDRYDEAYFGSVKFRALRGGARQVEQVLRGDEQALRFLLFETVADDTRIGEVLPDVKAEEQGERQKQKKVVSDGGAREGGESGVAEQPDEGSKTTV